MDRGRRDGDPKPVPIRGVVVNAAPHAHSAETMERCYQLWSTIAGTNAAATARWYEREAEDGTALPAARTIRDWARQYEWMQRREADFQRDNGQRLFELQAKYLAVMEGHADVMLDAQSGAYDENPMAGMLRLKPGELAAKVIERGILPLMPKPRDVAIETETMSREEQEAYAQSVVARGTKGRSA